MPERPRLTASQREAFGRKVNRLRRSGFIPANIVSPNQPSTAIQVHERDLAALVRRGADGRLLDLEWQGSTEAVLFDEYELDPITDRLRHATFRRVDLTRPVNVEVAIELQGTAPAGGVTGLAVIQALTALQVSALPIEIPSLLTADISRLEEPGDEIVVGDLRAVDGAYDLVSDPNESVIGVHVLRVQEEEPAEDLGLEEVEIGDGEDGEAPPSMAPGAEKPAGGSETA